MKKAITGCILGAATLLGGTAHAQPYAQPTGVALAVGDGYDEANAKRRLPCVTVTHKRSNRPSQKVRFSIDRIESAEQLRSALGLSASAYYKWGLTNIELAAAWNRTQSRHRHTVRLAVRVIALNEWEAADRAELKKSVVELNDDNFMARCGDHFVSATAAGGSFIALIEYAADSKEDKQEFTASVQVGAWSGGGTSKLEKALDKVQTSSKLTVKVLRIGGLGSIPTDLSGMLSAARNFTNAVATTSGNPRPVQFELQPYSTVGRKARPRKATVRDSTIVSLAEAQALSQSRLKAVNTILNSANDYAFYERATELAELTEARAALGAHSGKVQSAFDACIQFDKECRRVDESVPHPTLPPELQLAGGCRRWDKAGLSCLHYEVSAQQLGKSEVLSGRPLTLRFPKLPPNREVRITGGGLVSPAYSNDYGNFAGDRAPNPVDWYVTVVLDAESNSKKVSQSQHQRNILSRWRRTELGITMRTNGELSLSFGVAEVQLWPAVKGPLGLGPDFKFVVKAI